MSEDIKNVPGDELVTVTNITRSPIGYTLSSNNVRRIIAGGATVKVTADELRNLNLESGGDVLIKDYLRVNNRNLALEFGISEDLFDHEYNWDREKIDDVLLNGSMNEFLDALDFAPHRVIDMLVERAVELEAPDNNKLNALSKRTSLDIPSMVRNKHAYDENKEENTEEAPKTRRAAENEPEKVARRAK
jgi:hypothetical protein|nr:MAG TPA: hypothetical protein [Caudoviricetes sp.]